MNKLITRMPAVAIVVAVLGMLGSLGFQGYRFSQDVKKSSLPVQVAPKLVSSQNKPTTISSQTLKLFGDTSAKANLQPQQKKELPKTNLKLTLRGISSNDNDELGSALIEGPDHTTTQYKIGDSLPGNATLDSIFSDRVVLSRVGVQENLFFPKETTGGGIEYYPEDDNDAPAVSFPSPSAANMKLPKRNAPTSSISEERKAEIRRKLDELRQRMKVN